MRLALGLAGIVAGTLEIVVVAQLEAPALAP